MTIDDQIKDEKLQYNINREAAKISALSHQVKIINASFLQVKKYYYLIKKRIIEQINFTNTPLGKAFEKQIKTIAYQGIKQVEALKALKSDENNTENNT